MINPLTHARTPEEVATYKVEPYVVAADVYTAEGQLGRGGWTWYTGSASWMYRVGLEAILGFTKRGDTLRIEPMHAGGVAGVHHRVSVSGGAATRSRSSGGRGAAAAHSIVLDGVSLAGDEIPLVDDGRTHTVQVPLAPMSF